MMPIFDRLIQWVAAKYYFYSVVRIILSCDSYSDGYFEHLWREITNDKNITLKSVYLTKIGVNWKSYSDWSLSFTWYILYLLKS